MNKKAFALSNSSLTPYSIPQVPQGILPLAIGKMNLYLLNKVPSLSGFLLLRGKVLTPLMPHPQDKHSFTFQYLSKRVYPAASKVCYKEA